MKNNVLGTILFYVSLILAAFVIVPLGTATVTNLELIIKFVAILAGVVVLGLINALTANKEDKNVCKVAYLGASLAYVAYSFAATVFALLFALRMSSTLGIAISAFGAFGFLFLGLAMPKIKDKKSTFLPCLFSAIGTGVITYAYASSVGEIKFTALTDSIFVIGLVAAIVTAVIFGLLYAILAKKLKTTEIEKNESLYQAMSEEQLEALYEYSAKELTTRGKEVSGSTVTKEVTKEVIKEVPVEKVIERIVEKPIEIIKEVPVEKIVEKQVEVIKEVPVDRIIEKEIIKEVPVVKEVEVIKEVPVIKEVVREIVKEVPVEHVVVKEVPVEKIVEKQVVKEIKVDKIVEVKPERKPKAPKEKVVIHPTPQEIAAKAHELFNDIDIIYGKDEENYKIIYHKKPMMIVQGTTSDYRITYQRKPISATKMMIKYPNSVKKANSPQGEQWFKLVNKNDIEEKDIFDVIKFSHKYIDDAEAKAIAKKEAAIQKAKDKKAALKAKEKAKKDAIKAKEKAKEKALKAKEKEAIKKAQAKAKKEAAKAEASQAVEENKEDK